MSFMQMFRSDLIANIIDGIDEARASSFSKQLMFLTPKRKNRTEIYRYAKFQWFSMSTSNYSLVFNDSLNLFFFFLIFVCKLLFAFETFIEKCKWKMNSLQLVTPMKIGV